MLANVSVIVMATALTINTSRGDSLETLSVIWVDVSNNDIQNNVSMQQQLRAVINHLTIFQDDQECEDYIQSMSVDERVVLITVDQLGQKMVPRIHQLQHLLLIYIYSMDEKPDHQWTGRFTKVQKIFFQ